MIRVAAVSDIHFERDTRGTLRPHLESRLDGVDVLLLAGDLTLVGDPAEATAVARELDGLRLPVVTVLGNHDHHSDAVGRVRAILEDAGVRVLEGESAVLELRGTRVGVAGVKGFGGGFWGGSAEFGEPIIGEPLMRKFIAHSRQRARALQQALADLDTPLKLAIIHYSPIQETLAGEPPDIWAFLGSNLLAIALDQGGADFAVHGHAHRGSERGTTRGGVPVRNVAQQVIGRPFAVYELFGAATAAARSLQVRDR
jgi:Icc-related predicted phosphoesterase